MLVRSVVCLVLMLACAAPALAAAHPHAASLKRQATAWLSAPPRFTFRPCTIASIRARSPNGS